MAFLLELHVYPSTKKTQPRRSYLFFERENGPISVLGWLLARCEPVSLEELS